MRSFTSPQIESSVWHMPGVAGCDPNNCGYVLSATGTPDNNVVKSAAYNGALGLSGNLCYRTGYWAPSMATIVAKYGYLGDSGDCAGWPATGWIESPGELLAWIA